MMNDILFDVTYVYFDFDPHNYNRYEGCLTVLGCENAKQYAARIADAANVTGVNVTNAFTGEVVLQFDSNGTITFDAG